MLTDKHISHRRYKIPKETTRGYSKSCQQKQKIFCYYINYKMQYKAQAFEYSKWFITMCLGSTLGKSWKPEHWDFAINHCYNKAAGRNALIGAWKYKATAYQPGQADFRVFLFLNSSLTSQTLFQHDSGELLLLRWMTCLSSEKKI